MASSWAATINAITLFFCPHVYHIFSPVSYSQSFILISSPTISLNLYVYLVGLYIRIERCPNTMIAFHAAVIHPYSMKCVDHMTLGNVLFNLGCRQVGVQ